MYLYVYVYMYKITRVNIIHTRRYKTNNIAEAKILLTTTLELVLSPVAVFLHVTQ